MKQRHNTQDKIIYSCIQQNPHNVLAACCKAAAKIFRDPKLADLLGVEAAKNPNIRSVRNRWYRTLSKKNVALARGSYLYMMHSDKKVTRNRKVQRRDCKLGIPAVSTPGDLHSSASSQLRAYLYGSE